MRCTIHPLERMNMAAAKLRQIRVPDDPFYRAVARAKAEGSSIGAVTAELLRRYADGEIDV